MISNHKCAGYDVIGDIHGFSYELKELLCLLGYIERGGVYRHSTRTALFLGDFIDHGPENLEVVRIVRSMVEGNAAEAVMGNHEYYSLGFHSVDWEHSGCFLRKHSKENIRQHWDFLEEQSVRPREAGKALEWFRSLPLFIEKDDAKFVHGSWHQAIIGKIKPLLNADNSMPEEFFQNTFTKESVENSAIEILLKGRKRPQNNAAPYGHRSLDNGSVSDEGNDDKTVFFFSHHRSPSPKKPLTPRTASVDCNIDKSGHLCCYRWDGEFTLETDNFVGVSRMDAYQRQYQFGDYSCPYIGNTKL